MNTEKIKSSLWLVGLIVLILLGLWLIGLIRNTNKMYSYIGQSGLKQPSVIVTGEGKATVKPDIATMSFGLVSQNAALNVAQKDNTDKMNNFLNGLKKNFNVDSKDVQTSNYQVSPQYDWNNGQQKLIGYQINQTVTIKVRNLDKLGDLIAWSTKAQLNQVGSLQFTVDDLEKVRTQARAEAFAQVKQKAEDLAKASGIKLGKIISIQENANQIIPSPIMYAADSMMKGLAAPVAPTIETGSNEITADVSVEYEIL